MTDEQLAHYGVKGMHWGIRKRREGRGSVSRKRQSSDFKSTVELRKRHPSSLSNMQLKKVNERMQLERKHSQMNPRKIEKGHMAVKSILAVAGTATAVHGLATSELGRSIMNFNAKAPKHFVKPPGAHFK